MPASPLLIRLSAAIAALFISVTAYGKPLPKPPQDYFGDYGYCALVLSRNRHNETLVEAGPGQCQQALSPCSTFKLPNTLIGLQSGVVSGPDDVKKWDGKEHSRAVSNKDHSLQTAISDSIPWYFRAVARDVGAEEMTDWLGQLEYGNQDISAGIDRFWLGSSLKINAHGQLSLLKGLWHGTLPFNPDYQQQLRDMLVLDSSLDGILHGKTGSCLGAENQQPPDHGWFIGWVDWNETSPKQASTTFFVINTTGERAWGNEAKRIALEILQDLQPVQKQPGTTE
jgi:beta-lactamase class D